MDPRYFALLIGNSTFPIDSHNLQTLEGPVNDVALLRDALTHPLTGLFAPGDVRMVPERTMSEILIELETFFAAAGKDDRLLLYYSGHGLLTLDNQLLLCARDTRTDVARATAVSAAALNAMIDSSAATATIILLDCCYSGSFKSGGMPDSLRGSGRFLLTSCRSGELANDADRRNGTSLFTQHVIEGLLGAAPDGDGDGYVDLDDVYDYAYRRLRDEGRQLPQRNFAGHGQIALARRPPPPAAPPRPPLSADTETDTRTETSEDGQPPQVRPPTPPTPPAAPEAEPRRRPDEHTVRPAPTATAENRATAGPKPGTGTGGTPDPALRTPGANRPGHGRRPPTWLLLAVVATVTAFAIVGLTSGSTGRGPSGLERPVGIALNDAATELYVVDESRATLFRLELATGKLEAVFARGDLARPEAGGPPVAARLEWLRAVVVDSAGAAVFAADGKIYRRQAGGERTFIQPLIPGIDRPSVWGLAADRSRYDASLFAAVGPGPASSVHRIRPDGSTERVAGTGESGGEGDGGPALNAQISAGGIAPDGIGPFIIADAENHRVRVVDFEGTITTFAGNGASDYRGDDGKAVDASLVYPRGVAVDADGAVYVADEFAHVVRVISRDGIIRTFAGTGARGSSGDNGLATSARLNRPTAVAVDPQGNVYVSDTGNHRIRRIDTNGVIDTVA